MLSKRFARIVEECLHRLDRGENLPDVLAGYPADAEQLTPLLLVAMASRSMVLPAPSQAAQRLGANQMLAEMDQVGTSIISTGTPLQLRIKNWATRLVNAKRALRLIQPASNYRLAMITMLVIFGSGYFFLSASASPGDFFSAFSSDFQRVLAIFNQSFDGFPIADPASLNQSIKINGNQKLPEGVSGNEKIVLPPSGEEDEPSGYVYVDPYQERHHFQWTDPQDEGESSVNKDAEKDARKAEHEADKAAREAEREADKEERDAEKSLRQEELEDKLAQIQAAIEAKKDQKDQDK